MKKISLVIGILFLLIPTIAFAAYFIADENVPRGEIIMGNLYLAGGAPSMDGDVQGDLYITGGNVSVTGNVTNDLVAAGGTITVTGTVNDDIRVFGGQIYLDGRVNGEVIAFGGDVRIGPNANIRKDLVAGGGNINIDENSQVFGTTKIYTESEAEKAKQEMREPGTTGYLFGVLFTVLIYLVLAAVLMGLFPKLITKYLADASKKESFWKNIGLGLLVFLVTPIAAVLCFITGIGVMLGFVLLLCYILFILFNLVLAGVFFGIIAKKIILKQKKVEMDWLWALGGVVVLHLLTLVPMVGFFIGAFFFLFSFGASISTEWKVLRAVK